MASESKTTARALLARNPVAFDCIRSLEESIGLLAKATLPWPVQREGNEAQSLRKALRGTVTPQDVAVCIGPAGYSTTSHTHFKGRWESNREGARLVGEVCPGTYSRAAMMLLSLWMAASVAAAAWAGITKGWSDPVSIGAVVTAVIGLFVFPIVALGLGSSRIAREIEIIRAIGSVIGDPEKYAAPNWRRWKHDD